MYAASSEEQNVESCSRRYTFLLISDYLVQADFCHRGYVHIPYYSFDMVKFLKVCDTIVEAILMAVVAHTFSCTVDSSPIVTLRNIIFSNMTTNFVLIDRERSPMELSRNIHRYVKGRYVQVHRERLVSRACFHHEQHC